MLENINVINILSDQIKALLDLLQTSEDSVDIKSVKTASEMCMTMHEELMEEVNKIESKWRQYEEEKLPGDYIEEMIREKEEHPCNGCEYQGNIVCERPFGHECIRGIF